MNIALAQDWVDRHVMILSSGACGRAIGYLAGPHEIKMQIAPVGRRIVVTGDLNVPATALSCWWVPMKDCHEAVGTR